MDTFYLIVLGVATLVLIVALSYMGYIMSETKKGTRYPEFTTTCPDNWIAESADKCKRPASTKFNYGNAELTTYLQNSTSIGYVDDTGDYMNPSDPKWGANGDAVCEKKKWVKKYALKWDSVENANYCS